FTPVNACTLWAIGGKKVTLVGTEDIDPPQIQRIETYKYLFSDVPAYFGGDEPCAVELDALLLHSTSAVITRRLRQEHIERPHIAYLADQPTVRAPYLKGCLASQALVRLMLVEVLTPFVTETLEVERGEFHLQCA